ncbi:vacuolar protein sorting-associated protein 72 homolog isoform X1 [Galleria mellonella]|uniref:Vacuolar protein sorting-associated protein 72 homolog n=1 Tax=Galleria mellonella TaxID=7137 RepID=A0ABM3MST0_GALME|nr:vacuolar protein sorting-associated protein 72 homolog isoform X1 [Galleria mellonella]
MAQRERRSNAGNRMAKLLDEEEEDEFYKTTYGGFQDVEEDRDYIQEKEQDDVVDSDFDIDEDDEPHSDQEAESKEKRKTNANVYKDPNRKKKSEKPKKPVGRKTKEPKPKEEKTEKSEKITTLDTSTSGTERKSIRQSTAVKSAETQQRIKIRSELKKKKPKKVEEKWPTQEELLEEALETEKENLKSLERFEQIEMERKKIRPTKKTITGPVIRYHSFAVPLIEEVTEEKPTVPSTEDITLSDVIKNEDVVMSTGEGSSTNVTMTEPKTETIEEKIEKMDTDTKIDVEVTGPDEEVDVQKFKSKDEKPQKEQTKNIKYHERTLISFENDIKDIAFKACFPKSRPKRRRDLLCAVTKKPARYIDPVTKLPYRSVDAFRIIREAYYQQLEARGDRSDPQVAAWLQWRRADAASTYVQIHIK